LILAYSKKSAGALCWPLSSYLITGIILRGILFSLLPACDWNSVVPGVLFLHFFVPNVFLQIVDPSETAFLKSEIVYGRCVVSTCRP
jgi:hypothetical protein